MRKHFADCCFMAEQTLTDSISRTIVHFPVAPQLNQCIGVQKIDPGQLCHDPDLQCKTQKAEPFRLFGSTEEQTLTDSFFTQVYGNSLCGCTTNRHSYRSRFVPSLLGNGATFRQSFFCVVKWGRDTFSEAVWYTLITWLNYGTSGKFINFQ